MPAQVNYYNSFGIEFREAILASPQPHLWATDYGVKGRIYQEIKERIAQQEGLTDAHFNKAFPVLDVGCGFGRQAWLLAKKGFAVTGTDTSEAFIHIAESLFEKHQLQGRFLCLDLLTQPLTETFNQVLLFDVLEHIKPLQRKVFMEKVAAAMKPKGLLLLSLPKVKKRWRSQVNNNLRKAITQHIAFFQNVEEHPYPIPQEKEINNLSKNHFQILHSNTTKETVYYLLKRR